MSLSLSEQVKGLVLNPDRNTFQILKLRGLHYGKQRKKQGQTWRNLFA